MKKKTYYIITIGCQMNQADSDRLSAFLTKNNYKREDSVEKAGLVIVNTCGVRQSAENRAYGLVNNIRKANKNAKIVVTGCLSRREDVKKRLSKKVNLFMPISAMTDIFKLLEGKIDESKLSLDELRLMQGEKYLTILPEYSSYYSAFVPIGNGCNNFCSYCVVPYARGREVYRSAKDIKKEVKNLLAKGYKEITLIAQNVNSYKSGNYNFPKLLREIADTKEDFWLRFSSSHPKDVSPELINVIGSYEKICPHLHLAVQSGDDEILSLMNRKYTSKEFLDLVSKVRNSRPEIAITTDVIVGFPGEKRKHFNNTIKLFKKAKFDLAYISKYSLRPQTAAFMLEDDVSYEEKKRREKELSEIVSQSAHENNLSYEGKTVRVLIEGINKQNKYQGKTASNKSVIVSGNYKPKKEAIGSFVATEINEVKDFGLYGKLI